MSRIRPQSLDEECWDRPAGSDVLLREEPDEEEEDDEENDNTDDNDGDEGYSE